MVRTNRLSKGNVYEFSSKTCPRQSVKLEDADWALTLNKRCIIHAVKSTPKFQGRYQVVENPMNPEQKSWFPVANIRFCTLKHLPRTNKEACNVVGVIYRKTAERLFITDTTECTAELMVPTGMANLTRFY